MISILCDWLSIDMACQFPAIMIIEPGLMYGDVQACNAGVLLSDYQPTCVQDLQVI